jgi:hypothetical protein
MNEIKDTDEYETNSQLLLRLLFGKSYEVIKSHVSDGSNLDEQLRDLHREIINDGLKKLLKFIGAFVLVYVLCVTVDNIFRIAFAGNLSTTIGLWGLFQNLNVPAGIAIFFTLLMFPVTMWLFTELPDMITNLRIVKKIRYNLVNNTGYIATGGIDINATESLNNLNSDTDSESDQTRPSKKLIHRAKRKVLRQSLKHAINYFWLLLGAVIIWTWASYIIGYGTIVLPLAGWVASSILNSNPFGFLFEVISMLLDLAILAILLWIWFDVIFDKHDLRQNWDKVNSCSKATLEAFVPPREWRNEQSKDEKQGE